MSPSSLHTRRDFLRHAAAFVGAGVAASVATAADKPSAWKPRLAICNETFQDWPLEKALAFSAECGYQGVEFAPYTLAKYVTEIPAARRAEIRRQTERAGLQTVGLHWLLAKTEGLHITTADADVRRKSAEYLRELTRFCAELGGKVLVFGSPQQRNLLPGVSKEQAMRHAAEVFQAIVPELEKCDVTLALEPLAPGNTTFLTTAADAVAVLEMIKSPRCRLHLDCAAMSSEPTPILELIRKYRADCAHFHANDPNKQGPGFGKLDFVPILRTLREVGYAGWLSVEVFDYKPGSERLARESAQYLRQCLAKL